MSESRTTCRVALVQMAMSTEPAENLARAADAVRKASSDGAQLVCLPELFMSPYFCQVEDHDRFDLAEPIPGPATESLQAVAAECGVDILASLFERRTAGIYHNTLAVIDRTGSLAGKYRKMHIPDDPGYYEKFYFTPGDLGYQSFALESLNAGTLVCWDQWYPEAARCTALKGAEVIFYPTAIGWLPGEKDGEGQQHLQAWQTVQRGHAISNGLFVAAVNRVGTETSPAGSIQFWGHSFICDPFGTILAEASDDREETLLVDLDLGLVEETRRAWPFLRDRRIETYGSLSGRYDD